MPAPILNSPAFQKGVWGNSPLVQRGFDASLAVLLDEQFVSYDAAATTGDYVATQATTGTAATSTAFPGALLIDAGATTANQGLNLQRAKSAFVPAAGKDLWAEFLVQLTATTPPVTKWQGFVGLAALDTTLLPSGALTGTQNAVGWYTLTTQNLALTFWADKAGTNVTRTGTTLAAATDVKLGFRYDGTADTIQQYVNGVATGAAVPTANVPKVALYPSFVCQSDGSDRPNLIVKGYRILQLR